MPTSRSSAASKSNQSTATLQNNTVQIIQDLVQNRIVHESPIDINLSNTSTIELPKLKWHHVDLVPKKMKVTNTGHTCMYYKADLIVILSGKWNQERPYVSNGPFLGNYVFSQLHFHWGYNDMEGSEHTIDGAHTPLEMHVVLFKSCYLTQESALKKKDGIAVLAYFFKLQGYDNSALQILIDAIPYVQKPHCSARLDPLPLEILVKPFVGDYFLYWGSVTTSACVHSILWLLGREPIGVSVDQVDMFRTMLDINEEPLLRNYRQIQEGKDRPVFHVNPSAFLNSTLLSFPKTSAKSTPKSLKSPVPSTSSQSHKDVCAMREYISNPFNQSRYVYNYNGCNCLLPDINALNNSRCVTTTHNESDDVVTANQVFYCKDSPTTTCRARSVYTSNSKKRSRSSRQYIPDR